MIILKYNIGLLFYYIFIFLEKFFCIRNNPKPVNKFNKTMVLNKIKNGTRQIITVTSGESNTFI